GTTFEYNGKGGVKVAEDRGISEGFLEQSEYTLTFAVPTPGGVLLYELVEEFHDPKVDVDELAEEVSTIKE
ncbi:hypothetical protein C0993_008528, partial [Termitomyces sp. T159_Od127]